MEEDGSFFQLLKKAYRKKVHVDVVATKRSELARMRDWAVYELSRMNYGSAYAGFRDLLTMIENDPYPDEFLLKEDEILCYKWCIAYSYLNRLNTLWSMEWTFGKEVDEYFIKLNNELLKEHSKRFFTIYLQILHHFCNENWPEFVRYCELIEFTEDKVVKEVPFFNENIISELNFDYCRKKIQELSERCFYSQLEKFGSKDILSQTENKNQKVTQFYGINCLKVMPKISNEHKTLDLVKSYKKPLDEIQVHQIFHTQIFPMYFFTTEEYDNCAYFNSKFVEKCERCRQAHLQNVRCLSKLTNNKVMKDCFGDYATSKLEELNVKKETRPCRPTSVCIGTQTDSVKVQQMDGTYLDMYQSNINNLTAVINENSYLNDKIIEEKRNREAMEKCYQTQMVEYQKEVRELKLSREACEAEVKKLMEETRSLQIILQDYIAEKYNNQCNIYVDLIRKLDFKINYLKQLPPCSENLIGMSVEDQIQLITKLRKNQSKVHCQMDKIEKFYTSLQADMIQSRKFRTTGEWPKIPDLEKNHFVYDNFLKILARLQESHILNNTRSSFQADRSGGTNSNSTAFMPRGDLATANFQTEPSLENAIRSPQGKPELNKFFDAKLEGSSNETDSCTGTSDCENSSELISGNFYGANLDASIIQPIQNDQTDPSPGTSQSENSNVVNLTFGNVTTDKFETSPFPVLSKSKIKTERDMVDYFCENCPGKTEDEVIQYMLQVLQMYDGSFENVPKQRILEDIKSLIRTPQQTFKKCTLERTENKECIICFEKLFEEHIFKLHCNHSYHKKCIKRWLKNNSVCPVCRVNVKLDQFPPLPHKNMKNV